MRKAKLQKKAKSTDDLLKTSKKKDVELTEKELGKVSGGWKAQVSETLGLNFAKFKP